MKPITIVIILILILGIGWAIMRNTPDDVSDQPAPSVQTTTQTNTNPTGPDYQPNPTPQATVTATTAIKTGSEKSFTITGSNFAFAPKQITVKKGDTVKITFVNSEGMHDLKIDEFNATTKRLGTGQKETIMFVANKAGSFQYYCSVGEHRSMGMWGTLTVTE